jgi:hypothetical protein
MQAHGTHPSAELTLTPRRAFRSVRLTWPVALQSTAGQMHFDSNIGFVMRNRK